MGAESVMRIALRLDSRVSEALAKAFKPDDEVPPKGFEVISRVQDEHLIVGAVYRGELDEKTVMTFLSLADEVSRLTESFVKLVGLVSR